LRFESGKPHLRNLVRVLLVVRIEQLWAQLGKWTQSQGLVCMLDLARAKYVIENGSETAQPEKRGGL
jgi:hypothetical protein